MKGPARVLTISLAATALLYFVPGGRLLAWPLVLVSTLAHELGHGLAAVVLGGRFESLVIRADASGFAAWSGAFSRLGVAAVAAAGLIGPADAAFVLLAVGRVPRRAPVLLACLSVGLLLVAILLVRNVFGWWFTVVLAALCGAIPWRAPRMSQGVVVFVAVQLALSVYSRGDYLFTKTALSSAGAGPSDVAVMAAALFLPYWFWGALCGALSLLLLYAGGRAFFK
ncbi:MAG TPA: M50 family metallopeptidase [Vicinamibacterales bacterium]